MNLKRRPTIPTQVRGIQNQLENYSYRKRLYHGDLTAFYMYILFLDTFVTLILGNATFVKLNKATNMMLNIAQLPGLNFDSLGSVGCSG